MKQYAYIPTFLHNKKAPEILLSDAIYQTYLGVCFALTTIHKCFKKLHLLSQSIPCDDICHTIGNYITKSLQEDYIIFSLVCFT